MIRRLTDGGLRSSNKGRPMIRRLTDGGLRSSNKGRPMRIRTSNKGFGDLGDSHFTMGLWIVNEITRYYSNN